jgi:uncharacterized Tic20 family protein
MTDKAKRWAMVLHLSLYSFLLGGIGQVIVPILIWQIKKNELPEIDLHGKAVANWAISGFLYLLLLSVLLSAPLSDELKAPIYFLIPLIGGCVVIFPLIGTFQASGGKVWEYPLSIPFFR